MFFRVHGVCSRVQKEEVEEGGAYLVDRLHTCLYTVRELDGCSVSDVYPERLKVSVVSAGGIQQQHCPPQLCGRRVSVDQFVFSRSGANDQPTQQHHRTTPASQVTNLEAHRKL